MRITRLQLENWRNFRALDIDLRQRAFLIGPNASGKSNLLDAVRFLRDVANPVGGGLQQAVAQRGGLGAIRCLLARKQSDIVLEVRLGDDAGTAWGYRLVFGARAKQTAAFVKQETVTRFADGGSDKVLERALSEDEPDPEVFTETALEQTGANKEFRDIADFLRSVAYLHAVPQVIRDPARAIPGVEDPFGGHLLARIHATPGRTREARLKRMSEALKIAVPKLDGLEFETDERGVPHLKAKYKHWRPHGAWQREDQFSDGTLRLLGLLWALMERGGPLLLEEPELSLHAAVVARLGPVIRRATAKGGRQSLITTHSPDLLSDESIGLDEVFVLEPGENGTEVIRPGERADIRAMVEAGVPLAEAVMPLGAPEGLDELPLFAGKLV